MLAILSPRNTIKYAWYVINNILSCCAITSFMLLYFVRYSFEFCKSVILLVMMQLAMLCAVPCVREFWM